MRTIIFAFVAALIAGTTAAGSFLVTGGPPTQGMIDSAFCHWGDVKVTWLASSATDMISIPGGISCVPLGDLRGPESYGGRSWYPRPPDLGHP